MNTICRCRNQLGELKAVCPELKEQGIALHIITAETGGNDTVIARLAARGYYNRPDLDGNCDNLGFPIHADSEHKLLLPSLADGFYKIEEQQASNYNKEHQALPWTDYHMVQPALVVIDKTGAVVQKWSWLTMGITEWAAGNSAMTMVLNPDASVEKKEMPVVTARPQTADIGPSISEGRPVKLQSNTSF